MKFSEALAHMENGGKCVCGSLIFRLNEQRLEFLKNEQWLTDYSSYHTLCARDWQKAPTKKKVWVNLYKDIYGVSKIILGFEHSTREEADKSNRKDRIACVEIEVEGDGRG